jgi:hypothetical protein
MTELPADEPGFESRRGKTFFCSPKRPDRLWGPLTLPVNKYRYLPPPRGGAKRPGHEVHHSTLSSAEVENEWSVASVPRLRPYASL